MTARANEAVLGANEVNPHVPQSEEEAPFALSEMQYVMLLQSLVAPREGGYTLQKLRTIQASFDVPAFERACQRVVDQRSVLRTAFSVELGSHAPTQRILDRVTHVLEKQDWRHLARPAQQERLREWLTADRRRPFDFASGPPMRFALFRTGETEYEYVWSSHHAMMGGRSYVILVHEMFRV